MVRLLKIFLFTMVVVSCQFLVLNTKLFAEDKIVAIVNDEVITQKDLSEFFNFARMQLSREYKGKELESKLQAMKLDLLDRLIEDRLMLQEAKKEKIQVDEGRIKAKINEVKARYSSDTNFQEELLKQGLTQADIEKKIREQMLMYYVIEIKIKSKIKVRPEEVTAFYEQHKAEFVTGEVREFEAISLDKLDLAKSFAFDLKSGGKLEDLAARYPIKVNTLEVRKPGELRKEIEDTVFKLGVGEVSNPVPIDKKFLVFRVDYITASSQLPLSQVQEEIHTLLNNKKMQEEMAGWIDDIRKRSYIKIMQS